MDLHLKNVIVTPVYNDWQSFQFLVNELDVVSNSSTWEIEKIIAVNDGSNESIENINFKSKFPVTILNLNNNMGHQRAISVGLSYVEDELTNIDNILVMDSDGEDRPVDIDILLETLNKYGSKKIIFAKREKRSEGFIF